MAALHSAQAAIIPSAWPTPWASPMRVRITFPQRRHDHTKTKQSVIEANLTGALFTLPAGDAKFAATATYRKNSFTYDPDPAREGGDIIGTLASVPSSGKNSVKEVGLSCLYRYSRNSPSSIMLRSTLGTVIPIIRSLDHSAHIGARHFGLRSSRCSSGAGLSVQQGLRTLVNCIARRKQPRLNLARRPRAEIHATFARLLAWVQMQPKSPRFALRRVCRLRRSAPSSTLPSPSAR